MQAALATIWISVALGTALGLWQRFARGVTNPIRTFAVVAAALVVGLSLLPHAIASEGLLGLAGAALGFIAIPAIEQLVRAAFRGLHADAVRLEVGYAGLLLHRFGDGVAMSVEGHGHDLLFALGAHEIPIVALVTLAYARRGLCHALLRAGILGLSSSLGCWFVTALPAEAWHGWHGWADAIAAGILVHIVAHEVSTEALKTLGARALDVIAAALALLIVFLPAGEHAEGRALGQRWLALALSTAPWLSAALLASAALKVVELPWPAFAARGRRVAASVAAPDAAPETLALSIQLLGWPLAVLRLVAALGLGALAGHTVAGLRPRVSGVADHAGEPSSPEQLETVRLATPVASPLQRLWAALQEQVLHLGIWIMLGLLAASYIDVFTPMAALTGPRGAVLSVLSVSVLVLVAHVCAAAATPIAAALVMHGLAPGLALGALALGAATTRTALTAARAEYGARARTIVVALAVLGSLGLGMLTNGLLGGQALPFSEAGAASSSFEWLSLALLGCLLAQNVWRVGIRGWLASSLLHSHGAHGHGHSHQNLVP